MRYMTGATALLAIVLAMLTPPAEAQSVGISSLPTGTINNLQALVMGKTVQQHSGLQMRVLPVSGTTATLASIQNGEAEFAIGDVVNMTDALNAEGEFKNLKPMTDLRVALNFYANSIGIVVRNESSIWRIAHLKGKKFPVGFSAFPNAVPLCNGVLAAGGISMDDTDGVPTSGVIPAADDFKSGKTDATCINLEAPKVKELHSSISGGIRVLSMDNTPEAQERVRAIKAGYGIATIEPGPRFTGVTEPTNVLQVNVLITTGTRVGEDIVYKFVKAFAENKDEMAKGHPSFAGFQADATMAQPFQSVEYHPGAVKYFKERGFLTK